MGLGQSGALRAVNKTVKICASAMAISAVMSGAWVTWSDQALAQNFQFNRIAIEGNTRIGDAAILSRAGIEPGQQVTAGQVNDALQRLQNSGLFETVEVVPSGNTLRIVVVELPTVNRVRFEGNRRLGDEELAAIITTQERRVFNPTQAERDASNIAEAYAQAGRSAARVNPKIIRRNDNRVDLVFEIFEGDVVEVERISFVGNKAFSDRRLRRVLSTTQAGLLRQLIRTDTLVADRLQFDRQVLQDFYFSRGYVDFRILGTNAELAEERDGFFLQFNIEEGQQFSFGEVTVVSDHPAVNGDDYAQLIKAGPGVVYSPSLVEAEITRLERQAIRDGVDFLRVEPRVTRNDRDLTLDVEFMLTRGPRVFVERIDIEGNTTTLDRVVRQQFDIAEGDPFNPRAIRQAAERIRALGYFSTADVNAREGSRPDQVVVDVDLEEQSTGSLSFGASYSVNSGIGGAIQYTERNFLGRGQTLNLRFSSASEDEELNLQFIEPRVLGRDAAFGLNFGLSRSDSQFLTYDEERLIFQPSLTFPLGENSRLQVRYTASEDEMISRDTLDDPATAADEFVDRTGAIIDAEAAFGKQFTSSVGYTYTWDNRANSLTPGSGLVFEFGQDFAGLGGDNKYVKTTARLTGQRLAFREEVTLRATLEAGHLAFSSGQNRAIDRFFLNPNIIRGFEPGGIGPRDGGAFGDALGGNIYVAARLEAEFPLGLPEELGIRGAVFYDVGNLWDLSDVTIPAGATVQGESGSFRHVLGFSVLWDSVVGPLRFNFSRALEKESFDQEQTFDLTISTQF